MPWASVYELKPIVRHSCDGDGDGDGDRHLWCKHQRPTLCISPHFTVWGGGALATFFSSSFLFHHESSFIEARYLE